MPEASENGRGVVTERVRELVEALRAAPAIERFRTAEERFRADAELGRIQAGLRWSHERLQKAQREKRHDPRLFQEVRDGQARLQRHPLVMEFVTARQAFDPKCRRRSVGHSAASSVLAIRRALSDSSRYFSWNSVGPLLLEI